MSGPIMSGPIMRSDNGNNGRPGFIIYVYYRISRLLIVARLFPCTVISFTVKCA